MMKKIICLILFLDLFITLKAQEDSLPVRTQTFPKVTWYQSDSFKVVGKAISGNASTYSSKANGSKTASGEIFTNSAFTAACNKFKFNTWLKVTNPRNQKSVMVRVNDRTSKKKSAPVIELSRAASSKLGFLKTEIAKIKIEQCDLIYLDSAIKIKNDTLIKKLDSSFSVGNEIKDTFRIIGKAITGIASFYSSNLDGTKTATGERYRNNKLTAASNNFKLNIWVLVTNLRNQKTVIVRINDRMHPRMKKRGRVVDLSGDAAKQLDFIEEGLTKVLVQPIELIPAVELVKQETDSLHTDLDSSAAVIIDSVKINTAKPEQTGVFGFASFYSTKLEGAKTATGEVYRNNKMSAASNDFKLNTWVRITNLENNKSIILRINDRMDRKMRKKGRVVELSRIAVKRLDFLKNDLVRVKVEVVPKGTLE